MPSIPSSINTNVWHMPGLVNVCILCCMKQFIREKKFLKICIHICWLVGLLDVRSTQSTGGPCKIRYLAHLTREYWKAYNKCPILTVLGPVGVVENPLGIFELRVARKCREWVDKWESSILACNWRNQVNGEIWLFLSVCFECILRSLQCVLFEWMGER